MEHQLENVPSYEDLTYCTVCKGAEGTLPSECPGIPMTEEVQALIMKGHLDFIEGRWQIVTTEPVDRSRIFQEVAEMVRIDTHFKETATPVGPCHSEASLEHPVDLVLTCILCNQEEGVCTCDPQ